MKELVSFRQLQHLSQLLMRVDLLGETTDILRRREKKEHLLHTELSVSLILEELHGVFEALVKPYKVLEAVRRELRAHFPSVVRKWNCSTKLVDYQCHKSQSTQLMIIKQVIWVC